MSSVSTTPYVPYQAYKSKRHSRVVSLTSSVEPCANGNGTVSPPPQSKHTPSSSVEVRAETPESLKSFEISSNDVPKHTESQPPSSTKSLEKQAVPPVLFTNLPKTSQSPNDTTTSPSSLGSKSAASSIVEHLNHEDSRSPTSPSSPQSINAPSETNMPPSPSSNLSEKAKLTPEPEPLDSQPVAGPSTLISKPTHTPRKSTTFRYVPLRPPANSAPRTSSPLRPPGTNNRNASVSSSSPLAPARHFDQSEQFIPSISPKLQPSTSNTSTSSITTASDLAISPQITKTEYENTRHQQPASIKIPVDQPVRPPQRTSSLPPPPPPASTKPIPPSPTTSSVTSRVQSPVPSALSTSTSTSTPVSYKAVYRPGFQPKGVYRPLTDDFIACRKRVRDTGRIELTRLERRFEKLIDLHFSPDDPHISLKGKEKPSPAPSISRRASSFFEDLGDLKSKSASDIWRGILDSRVTSTNGGKGDIRAAEQRITPWQDDADVSACPHCSASFHPLTNRKHHCRLCGKIICSLPIKKPQRPIPCSILFISDPKTGRIEEVSEGVDYGVRPRARADSMGAVPKGVSAEEKFLKGVRICKECKPVMLRQQYRHESKRTPTMIRLYEALISLEAEIEESLPQFQELMLSLSNNVDEAPTKEAVAVRKHLLQCFADYDIIAKRIRKIPCPAGPGSSQDRIQTAILARANMFLQKNMFPLQSLPKPKKRSASGSGTKGDNTNPDGSPAQVLDPDSELAQALQPLLEQEALLETFVEEATAHRKFEDARTLRANLAEIRAEIDRIVANAGAGMN